jgi:hypothetical protein
MLSFIVLSTLVYSQNDPSCFSLASSRACPEYKGTQSVLILQVTSQNLLKDYSILALPNSFANAQAFDSYVQSKSGWNYNDQCPQFRTAAQAQIRYSNSFICGFAVYASTQGLQGKKCNQGVPTPPAVCQSSLNAAIQDVDAILKRACPTRSIFTQYSSYAASQKDSDCILAVGPEIPLKCGMNIN